MRRSTRDETVGVAGEMSDRPSRDIRSAAMATVESVKAASDVYAPVSGTVTDVNSALTDSPALVNESAEDKAWFVKIKLSDAAETGTLLSADAYKALCDAEKH